MCSSGVDDPTSALTAVLSGSPAVTFWQNAEGQAQLAPHTFTLQNSIKNVQVGQCTVSVSLSGTFGWHSSKGLLQLNNSGFSHLWAL